MVFCKLKKIYTGNEGNGAEVAKRFLAGQISRRILDFLKTVWKNLVEKLSDEICSPKCILGEIPSSPCYLDTCFGRCALPIQSEQSDLLFHLGRGFTIMARSRKNKVPKFKVLSNGMERAGKRRPRGVQFVIRAKHWLDEK